MWGDTIPIECGAVSWRDMPLLDVPQAFWGSDPCVRTFPEDVV